MSEKRTHGGLKRLAALILYPSPSRKYSEEIISIVLITVFVNSSE